MEKGYFCSALYANDKEKQTMTIATNNIQAYINFLHFKKYLLPATEVLLSKWASLSDEEIRSNLDGLYAHWGINQETAGTYEAEFLMMQAAMNTPPVSPKPETVVLPEPEVPEAMPELPERRGSKAGRNVLIVLVLVLLATGAWYYYNRQQSPAAEPAETKLQQEVDEAKQVAEQERRLRLQQDSLQQAQAAAQAAKAQDFKANRSKYVQRKVTYDYDGMFGGIKNVTVTVTNSSAFKLNEVTLELNYIKKNGDRYESQKVSVFNIAPKQSKTITAPNSKRGTSLESTIIAVQSDEVDAAGL